MIGIRDRNEPNGYKTNSTTQKVDATLSSTSNNPPSNKAVTNAINPLINYSEDETVVGSFMGKPIYRKYIYRDNLGAIATVLVENVDWIINESLYFKDSSLPLSHPNSWLLTGGSRTIYDGVAYQNGTMISNNHEYIFWIDGKSGIVSVKGFIEYTKTTD